MNAADALSRKVRRVAVAIPILIIDLSSGRSHPGEIRNLSEGGAFVKSSFRPAMGQSIEVRFSFRFLSALRASVANAQLWIEQPSEAVARPSIVRWTEENETDGGFGIEFSEMDEEAQTMLRSVMRYYEMLKIAGVSF